MKAKLFVCSKGLMVTSTSNPLEAYNLLDEKISCAIYGLEEDEEYGIVFWGLSKENNKRSFETLVEIKFK